MKPGENVYYEFRSKKHGNLKAVITFLNWHQFIRDEMDLMKTILKEGYSLKDKYVKEEN